jgi:hypothetical protein
MNIPSVSNGIQVANQRQVAATEPGPEPEPTSARGLRAADVR